VPTRKLCSDCFVTRSPTIADAIRRKTNDASAKEIHHRLGLLTKANVAKFVITEGNIWRVKGNDVQKREALRLRPGDKIRFSPVPIADH
jgi:hypothetical protein